MLIQEVYETYHISDDLQLHMLRVTAWIYMICESYSTKGEIPLNGRDLIIAWLLHDIANIIKTDFTIYPDFFKEKWIEYWKNIKKNMISKYGENEEEATMIISKELGVSSLTREYIQINNLKTWIYPTLESKILTYMDMRVSPTSIVSYTKRMNERKNRNPNHEKIASWRRDERCKDWEKLEKEIFSSIDLHPEDINDQTACKIIEKLRKFSLT